MIYKYYFLSIRIISILLVLSSFKVGYQVTSLSILNVTGEVGKGKDWKYGYQINALEFQRLWWPGLLYGFAYYLAIDFKGGGKLV